MSSSTVNLKNDHDAMKGRQKEVRQRWRQTEKGQACLKRQRDRHRERIADDPEYRERVRVRDQHNRSSISRSISYLRRVTKLYNEPVYVFYINKGFVIVPEKLRKAKRWHYSVINGKRIKRTFSSLNRKYPDCFIGGYDAKAKFEDIKEDFVDKMNDSPVIVECTSCRRQKPITEFHKDRHNPNGYRRRCKDCQRSARGAGEHKQSYNLSAIPSLKITQGCPCAGCEYEKPCEILALDCPCYRSWQKSGPYKKLPRVPDKHLDGSKPGPGVI